MSPLPELWLPIEDPVAYTCHCGATFTEVRKGQKHAIKCAERLEDEIAEESELRRSSAFTDFTDPEEFFWGRKREAKGKVGFRRGRAA